MAAVRADGAATQAERDFDDPLAVEVGLLAGAEDIPCDGWPEEVDSEVLERILQLLPSDEEELLI